MALANGPPMGDADTSLTARFRNDVLAGLAAERKSIPARWFYDRRGSELFEQITRLPEYYPTRTETGILAACAAEIQAVAGAGRVIVEFGAGSMAKTPLLIDAVHPAAYVAVDISGEFLRESCLALGERYRAMPIYPLEADFTRPIALPPRLLQFSRLGFFPGSTIGNMAAADAVDLLRSMRKTLGDDSLLLIGLDCIKDRGELLAAYDDAAGVTAAFNLNLVHRINRELNGDIPVADLRHRVLWDDPHARIAMHLEAARDMAFTVSGQRFSMKRGETIHTENSHKYDFRSAAMLLLAGNWEPLRQFADPAGRFLVILSRASDAGTGG